MSDEPTPVGGRLAAQFPELKGVPWFPGIGDGAASNLGSGATRPGLAAINVGTSAAVRVIREAKGVRAPLGLSCYRSMRSASSSSARSATPAICARGVCASSISPTTPELEAELAKRPGPAPRAHRAAVLDHRARADLERRRLRHDPRHHAAHDGARSFAGHHGGDLSPARPHRGADSRGGKESRRNSSSAAASSVRPPPCSGSPTCSGRRSIQMRKWRPRSAARRSSCSKSSACRSPTRRSGRRSDRARKYAKLYAAEREKQRALEERG